MFTSGWNNVVLPRSTVQKAIKIPENFSTIHREALNFFRRELIKNLGTLFFLLLFGSFLKSCVGSSLVSGLAECLKEKKIHFIVEYTYLYNTSLSFNYLISIFNFLFLVHEHTGTAPFVREI